MIMRNNRKLNWYRRAKRKDPNFSEAGTQLVVHRLPEGLLPRVHKHCKANGIYIRRFVAESLELGLKKQLGAQRERG
jgi:hypothetical protein